jgi:hypothetical protein
MKVLKLGQSLCSSNTPSAAGFENIYSLNFDGVDDFVNLGNDASLRPAVSGGVSVSVWCKWTDITTATSRIFSTSSNASAYNGLSCSKNATGYISMNTGDGSGFSSTDRRTLKTNAPAVSNNTWHHIVFVWTDTTNSNWKIYVDGSDIASTTSGTGGVNVYTTDDAFIGKRIMLSTSYANGNMDEVSLWDKALSGAEVTAIYNSGCPTELSAESNLIGYWRNGDTTGTAAYPTITDDSSNSNDGTMTNMVLTDIIPETPCQTFANLYSLDFDGVDDYLTFGDSNDFSFGDGTSDTPFSVSAWINMSDATKFRILSKSSSTGSTNVEWGLFTTGTDLLGIILYDNNTGTQIKRLTASVASYEGTWIQACGTYDGSGDFSGINIYINGVNANDSGAEVGTYVAMHSTSAPLDMGRFANPSGTTYSDGNIDEVSLWDKQLSAAEVLAIYNSGTPTDLSGESNLVGYWRNGDIQGTSSYPSLHDFSENNNLGTMTNMISGDIVTDVP